MKMTKMHLVNSESIQDLLRFKYVIFAGDSCMRTIYKDMVLLLQGTDRLLTEQELKAKSKRSICNDHLLEGGIYSSSTLGNNSTYYEKRAYFTTNHLMKFVFLTRCLNAQMFSILKEIDKHNHDPKLQKPDVILLNSAIWDITQYRDYGGENVELEYKTMLNECFKLLSEFIPENCIVIWLTTLPFSEDAKAGVFNNSYHRKKFLRIRILEINTYSSYLASKYGFEVIDLHRLFRGRTEHRVDDGMHYDEIVHREITTIIAKHIACIWNVKLSVPISSLPLTIDDDEKTPRDNDQCCKQILASIVDKIDNVQLTIEEKTVLEQYFKLKNDTIVFDVENLSDKEKQAMYLLNYYEKLL
ncbi:unnamed protein product [Didymodactylos carnosus]|uniref:Uncharacterized protein n=1 Tax=Didymodactylos carnosus TaxID=1234261 RepID=A0A813QX78_9BILA|nr:unnamed protein product [Didymodactylos carnosus]CAF1181237.1 unnamed protein product [Didymodactylos carnosus]CAF3555527.1 unnamed protein product [Didymodactylos carnosus]CAF3992532.1 unnamed protein product [Didymodactylos carnosus]